MRKFLAVGLFLFSAAFLLQCGTTVFKDSAKGEVPAPTLLGASAPDAQGIVTVTGEVAAVLPGAEVRIIRISNQNGEEDFISQVAEIDGSFEIFLMAETGDILRISQVNRGEEGPPVDVVVP